MRLCKLFPHIRYLTGRKVGPCFLINRRPDDNRLFLHENWRTDVVIDNSYNHIMFGEIGAWLYKGLGGIQIDEKHPGFKHILLKPFFPADMNELTIRYNTPYGWLNINWVRQTNDCIRYTIDIPAGTSAT